MKLYTRLFIINLLLIIFAIFAFCYTEKVHALDINTRDIITTDTNWTLTGTYWWLALLDQNAHSNEHVFGLNQNISTDKSYVYLQADIRLTELGYNRTINFNEVDFTTTCSNGSSWAHSQTITYADGSTATISPGFIEDVCDLYVTHGGAYTANYFSSIIDETPTMEVKLQYTGGGPTLCEQYGQTFKCPIKNGATINGIKFRITTNGGTHAYRLYVEKNIVLASTAEADIIANNTQNTQSIINSNNTINSSIQDTNNTLKDSNIDNPSSTTSQWSNMNASNGTITTLLTLPISLMQAYVNGMSDTCSSFSLGTLFNTNIVLPCINLSALLGPLYGIIDVLFSGFMVFAIAKKLIKIFNDFTNMKSNQVDELYGGGA